MWTKQLRRRFSVLFLMPLLIISGKQVRGEEILVQGVPYIAQKAHLD